MKNENNIKAPKKLTLMDAFNDVFGKEDKYFGEWFIKSDESLPIFLDSIHSKEKLIKQFRHLFLFLESLEVLKKQSQSEEFSIARVYSRETWYCCVLLLIIGIIDQHTKHELNDEGKLRNQKSRFQIVMNNLSVIEQKYFLTHYDGSRFKVFDELTSKIYSTRTFFAHEIIIPDDGIPQDSHLGFDRENIGRMFINMPHGQIFLYIVTALMRYLGFRGKIEISSNKKFEGIVDFLRRT